MQYLFTERAHLMCPHMNFGIAMAVCQPFDEARIRETMEKLSAAHPFLKALLGYEKDKNAYFYRVTDTPQAELLLKDREIGGTDDPAVLDEYRKLTERDWNLTNEGMLKTAAWPMQDGTGFLLVFHHLLADGRGALGLARELADCYVTGKQPEIVEEKLIASADEFPKESRMPFISRFLIGRANRSQTKEQKILSYPEYHAFADLFLKKDKVRYSVSRIGAEEVEKLRQTCHGNGVTLNDYLLAKMMIEDRTKKVIMACDLRGMLGCYTEGALGNYSTAFSVEVKETETDPCELAKAVHRQVQRKMKKPQDLYLVLQCYANLDPAVLDAAFMACRGDYQNKPARFVGSVFFGFEAARGYSITNLGKIDNEYMTAACFIPPASPAIRKTQGILTVNGQMTVCTSER